MNIDQALIELCCKHNLTAISLGATVHLSKPHFTAYAHAASAESVYGYSGSEIADTASEAIAHAIQQVNEARACVVEVPAMELEVGA